MAVAFVHDFVHQVIENACPHVVWRQAERQGQNAGGFGAIVVLAELAIQEFFVERGLQFSGLSAKMFGVV